MALTASLPSPAGGIRKFPAPTSAPTQQFSVHYNLEQQHRTFNVAVPKSPPEELLLNVEAAVENGAVFMRAIEVDVAVEGETHQEAVQSLARTIMGWLEFLREEEPELAPDLEPQRGYIELLRYHPLTWFKSIRID